MEQDELRKRVRFLKALKNVSYKELSGYLEITQSAMYNWLHSQFELSEKRALRLEEIISNLEE